MKQGLKVRISKVQASKIQQEQNKKQDEVAYWGWMGKVYGADRQYASAKVYSK